jgi:hypothetical protein
MDAGRATDPVIRMKNVLAFIIAGLHLNPATFKSKSPINCVLGETFHATNEKGMKVYLEQTSINPPTSHFYIKAPDNLFEIFGYAINTLKMTGVNTLRGGRDGKNIIRFKDGTLMTWVCPEA